MDCAKTTARRDEKHSKFWNLVCLILEILGYIKYMCEQHAGCWWSDTYLVPRLNLSWWFRAEWGHRSYRLPCGVMHVLSFKVTRDKKSLILRVSGQLLQFEFIEGFGTRKAWCNVEEVLDSFSRSSIEFQGHTDWKIKDLNPISVRLLGLSQLSNPSDLSCF